MFNKKLKTDNKYLRIENDTLKNEIKELKSELKKYKEDRDNTLLGILKDFDYAIIVDKGRTKLFNAGRWEEGVKSINFEHEAYSTVPVLTIEK